MMGHLHNTYSMNPPIVLILDEYEAANLLWLLAAAHMPVGSRPEHLNTGDWCGQLRLQLRQAMMENQADRMRYFKGYRPVKPNTQGVAFDELEEALFMTGTFVEQRTSSQSVSEEGR